jgi:peptidoglycan hydrolase CwlO-like protein
MEPDMKNDDAILLEDIDGKLAAIREGQAAMASVPGDIAQLKNDMSEVKADIKVIKAVVTDHSKQLDDHEIRITTLEQAV